MDYLVKIPLQQDDKGAIGGIFHYISTFGSFLHGAFLVLFIFKLGYEQPLICTSDDATYNAQFFEKVCFNKGLIRIEEKTPFSYFK